MITIQPNFVFDFNEFQEFITYEKLQYYSISFNGKTLALATDNTLILTTAIEEDIYSIDQSIQVVLEFNSNSSGMLINLSYIIYWTIYYMIICYLLLIYNR